MEVTGEVSGGFEGGGGEAVETSGDTTQHHEEGGIVEVDAEQEAVDDTPEYKKIKHKLKVDQEELDLDYDEVIRRAQKSTAAEKRIKEATLTKREAESIKQQAHALINGLKSDPRKALFALLGNEGAQKFCEEIVWEDLQRQRMTPEQRELADLRQEKQRREAEETERRQREEKEQHERAIQEKADQYRAHYDQLFSKALESSSLPKTAHTIARMSQIYAAALQNGQRMDPGELAEVTKETILSEIKATLPSMPKDKLVGFVGEDIAKMIRESDQSRLKNPRQMTRVVEQKGQKSRQERPLTLSEWREEIERKTGVRT